MRNFQHFHIMDSTPEIKIKVKSDGSNECATIDEIEALYNFVENDMSRLQNEIQKEIESTHRTQQSLNK